MDKQWIKQAACRDLNPKDFDPDTATKTGALRAARVCRNHCPVRDQCLAFAQQTEAQAMIFGGYRFDSLTTEIKGVPRWPFPRQKRKYRK